MKRREFVKFLGGAAATIPFAAHAQQADRTRRVGVLMNTTPDNPDSQVRIAALRQGLQQAGWSVGRDLRIDISWSSGDVSRLQKGAADLIALGPDVGWPASALPRRHCSG